jgi:hypothetical protein
MIPTKIRVGLALLALVGCRDEPPKPANFAEAFSNLPLPPEPRVVSREAGTDAVKLTLVSSARAAAVEAYYRKVLSTQNGWRLVSDARDAQGVVVLMAEQDGSPLWVRIQSTDDSLATVVELAGAVVSRQKASKPAS